MPDKIDYDFISQLEGGRQTIGYVPDVHTSQSGGFDLGQKNENDLNALNLPQSLINKLKPYLGKKRTEAEEFLKTYPLIIEDSDAQIIDKAVKKNHCQVKLKQ
ncbi:pesticin C-terminus-like muramidase [Candidatus Marithrix sp. Canyon 246]|uniref:pesticin C-terminus-like muramidase n=1 Tax=Candidatus Marithrix sp. Canyon 246 TaxID=1827136 RepID=UPI000849FBB5|nr:pesticin C-terminus-like muramidase [Candidatus Marithrix sp. Canyon 246]